MIAFAYLLWEKIGWEKIKGVKVCLTVQGSSVGLKLGNMLGMESDVIVGSSLHLLFRFWKIKLDL